MAEIKLLTKILNRYNDSRIEESSVLGRGEIHFEPVAIPLGKDGATEIAVLMKVGDGNTTYANLDYLAARAADVYDWAKAAEKPVYNANEIEDLVDFVGGAEENTKYTFAESEGKLVIKSIELGSSEETEVASIAFVNPTTLAAAIKVEEERAIAKENEIVAAVEAEASRADTAEKAIAADLAEEIGRATGVEAELDAAIKAEATRADAAEKKALEDAKAYADGIKSDLLGEGSISETYDTLKEIADWIETSGVETTDLTSAIAAETKAREDADAEFDTRIKAYEDVAATLATKSEVEAAEGRAAADATSKANTAEANAIAAIKAFYSAGDGLTLSEDGVFAIDRNLVFVLDANEPNAE